MLAWSAPFSSTPRPVRIRVGLSCGSLNKRGTSGVIEWKKQRALRNPRCSGGCCAWKIGIGTHGQRDSCRACQLRCRALPPTHSSGAPGQGNRVPAAARIRVSSHFERGNTVAVALLVRPGCIGAGSKSPTSTLAENQRRLGGPFWRNGRKFDGFRRPFQHLVIRTPPSSAS